MQTIPFGTGEGASLELGVVARNVPLVPVLSAGRDDAMASCFAEDHPAKRRPKMIKLAVAKTAMTATTNA
jgi:hypothetical protein